MGKRFTPKSEKVPKPSTLGEFIAFYSREHDKFYGSQKAISKKTGVPISTLSRWVDTKPHALLCLLVGSHYLNETDFRHLSSSRR